jgi:hypothetical protein
MRSVWLAILILLSLLGSAGACSAADVSLGLYAHDVPWMGAREHEKGEEVIATVGSSPVSALTLIAKPSVYLTAGVNMQGKTNFVASGLRWKVDLTKKVYVRAGIGLALNDAPRRQEQGRVYMGSNLTFEPEAAVGWKLTRKVAIEASAIHLSQARIFSSRNPGINEIGLRVVVRFDQASLLHHRWDGA